MVDELGCKQVRPRRWMEVIPKEVIVRIDVRISCGPQKDGN